MPPLSLIAEQRGLGGRSAKGRTRGSLVRAFLVEAKALAVNFEQTLSCLPVWTFAAHAFTEDARVQLTFARFANSVQHAVGFGRKLFTQTLFKIRSDISRQTQHVDEGRLGAGFFRAFQQHGNVARQSRNDRRDSDTHSNARACERSEERRVGKECRSR